MIVSHTHRYLFVEVPRTGCTAVARELCEHYDGEPVLYKHAHLTELPETLTSRVRDYVIGAGVRNPLDRTVSRFEKLRSDHKANYTTPTKRVDAGGWVTARDVEEYEFIQRPGVGFPEFFARYHRRVARDQWAAECAAAQVVLRFEALEQGFAEFLRRAGLPQHRPLPHVNPTTRESGDYRIYYTPEVRQRAVDVFGPLMQQYGYGWPEEWGVRGPSLAARIRFARARWAALHAHASAVRVVRRGLGAARRVRP